jgi:hypothetical protein
MAEELRIVTTVGSEAEAEMVGEWLSEAGIRSMPQLSSGNIRLGAAAPREVYVEAKDHDRAIEVINGEVPSEAELAALSDAAVTQQTQPKGTDKDGKPYRPTDIPVPERSAFDRLIARAANTPPRERS